MFILAKIQGVSDEVLWGEWYYSDTWQHLGAISNSIPIFLFTAVVCYGILKSWMQRFGDHPETIQAIMFAALAALMHTVTDLPLHNDDGHPHFWPLSLWIYQSPVSYWDPDHFGLQWSVVELIIAAGLIIFLWRRTIRKWVKSLLILVGVSYATVAVYWSVNL